MRPITDPALQRQPAHPKPWDEALAERYWVRGREPEDTADDRGEPPPGAQTGPRRHRVWSPAEGPSSAPEQQVPAPAELLADGSVPRVLWAPSEGPCRVDPGGAGGEPNGRSLPIRKVVWD